MGEALAVMHKLKVPPVKSDPEIGGRYKAWYLWTRILNLKEPSTFTCTSLTWTVVSLLPTRHRRRGAP